MGSRVTLLKALDDEPRLFCVGGRVLREIHPWTVKRPDVLYVPDKGAFFVEVVPRGLSCAYPK